MKTKKKSVLKRSDRLEKLQARYVKLLDFIAERAVDEEETAFGSLLRIVQKASTDRGWLRRNERR